MQYSANAGFNNMKTERQYAIAADASKINLPKHHTYYSNSHQKASTGKYYQNHNHHQLSKSKN